MKQRGIYEKAPGSVSTNDVAPALDLLSSAVQIPDLGAKILLIYTCLEHLFVPKGTKSNQRLYVLGGLKALRPSLVGWFDNLYKLRCDYAHRGFVIRDDQTMSLVRESVSNVMVLLTAKLSVASVLLGPTYINSARLLLIAEALTVRRSSEARETKNNYCY